MPPKSKQQPRRAGRSAGPAPEVVLPVKPKQKPQTKGGSSKKNNSVVPASPSASTTGSPTVARSGTQSRSTSPAKPSALSSGLTAAQKKEYAKLQKIQKAAEDEAAKEHERGTVAFLNV